VPEQILQNRSNPTDANGITHRHILKINVPKGSQGAYISHVAKSNYGEFVMPRNTEMKYSHTDSTPDGKTMHHIHHMELIK
jgi:hypothetical protein